MTLLVAVPATAADPLPAWRDGPTRQRLLDFVTRVTTPNGPGYVTPAERIAVFDDDGTLWPEKPRAQGMLALPRIRALAESHPEWRLLMPYRGALELGGKYLAEAGDDEVLELVATAYAGSSQDDFRAGVRQFFAEARHPRWDQPYGKLVYQPMRELIGYLRANGFRSFIVTTGNVDVVRELAEDVYGLPADDVIGSSVVTTLREESGRMVVRRLKTVHALNDGNTKALSIDYHLGRRPLIAAGNVGSGGDVSMLRWSQGDGRRPSLQVLVRHDDFEREYAYDEAARESLNAADRHGWMVISMRYDWKQVFGFQPLPAPAPVEELPTAAVPASITPTLGAPAPAAPPTPTSPASSPSPPPPPPTPTIAADPRPE